MRLNRFFAAAALAALGFAGAMSLSAGEPGTSRQVSVTNFSGIDVSSGIEVVYVPSSEVSAVIQAPKDKISRVKVVQRGEMLNISIDGMRKAKSKGKVKVTVSAPLVNTFMASSGAEIKCRSTIDAGNRSVSATASSGAEIDLIGVNCRGFNASVSSGAEIDVNRLNCSNVAASASSGAEIDLGGSAQSVELSASSGASVDAGSLVAESGSASATSGSNVKCNITGKTKFTTSGGGSVKNLANL